MVFKSDVCRNLISRAPDSALPKRAEVEGAIVDATAEIARAGAAITRLGLARPNVLINGSDADLEAHDALVSAETRARDRATALKKELSVRLEEIAEAEHEKEMVRARAEAERLTNAACAELRKYPALALQIVEILATVAKADVAVKAVNQKYPDQPSIADAETIVRRDPGQPKKILSEKTVDLWAGPYGAPVEAQNEVKPSSKNPEKGTLKLSNGQEIDVEKRTFQRVKFLQAENGHTPPRLDHSLVLPGFFGAAGDIYNLYLSTQLQTLKPGQEPTVITADSRTSKIEFIPVSAS
jgi:hypothetical protein